MASIKSALIVSAALALLAVAPVRAADEPAAATEAEQTFPAIVVVKVSKRDMTDRTIVTGSVRAIEEVSVSPLVEGLQVKDLLADVGATVKAGDVVATLNDDALLLQKSQLEANKAKIEAGGLQIQAQLIEAKANADEAERQAVRAETLAKSGTIPAAQAEQARAAATAARARLNSAEQGIAANKADIKVIDAQIADIDLRLARTSVKAPVSGIVTARNARIGAIASGAGQPLFTIMRDGALEVVADVAESDILKLQPGQKTKISVAGGSEVLNGSVRLIEPAIDAQTRLGKVRIAIDDPSKARAGMFASADIVVAAEASIALPLTAVTVEKSGAMVRKVEDERIKLVPVTTGFVDGEFIEILSGLAEGDVVVLKAGAYVRDGDRIKPVMQDEPVVN